MFVKTTVAAKKTVKLEALNWDLLHDGSIKADLRSEYQTVIGSTVHGNCNNVVELKTSPKMTDWFSVLHLFLLLSLSVFVMSCPCSN